MDVRRSLAEKEEKGPTLDGMIISDISFREVNTIVDLTSDYIKFQRQEPISEKQIMKELIRYF